MKMNMCAAPDIKEWVDSLEAIFGQFMIQSNIMLNRMFRKLFPEYK